MTDSSQALVAELTVPAGDADLLTEITTELGGDGVTFGPERTIDLDTQLYFDPSTAVEAVKSVTTVISGVGAAIKVVDYLIQLVRRSPQKRIVVTVGQSRVLVSGSDPAELRAALRAALKLV